MSRRLREEENQRLRTTKEDDYDEDMLKLRKERIYAPILWRRLGTGYRIQDLKEKYFEETLELLNTYYIPNEVLCRNTDMTEDEVSVQSFLDKVLFHLRDCTSLVLIDESLPKETEEDVPPVPNDEIAGVLILRAIHKADFGRVFSRIIMTQGDAQKKCVQIKTALNRKVDIYDKMNCDTFLRYYYLCIKPKYRHKGLGLKLMISALDVARTLKIPVVMGIFTDYLSQKLATKIGMEVQIEINYVEWRDKNGEMIFDDPGAGNYTCALMAGYVPQEPIPEPTPPKPTSTEPVKKEKITRKDKRELTAKRKRKEKG